MTQAELLRYPLLAAFPPEDSSVSEDAAREAVAQRGQFNIVQGYLSRWVARLGVAELWEGTRRRAEER